jgi:hypothetical protein
MAVAVLWSLAAAASMGGHTWYWLGCCSLCIVLYIKAVYACVSHTSLWRTARMYMGCRGWV